MYFILWWALSRQFFSNKQLKNISNSTLQLLCPPTVYGCIVTLPPPPALFSLSLILYLSYFPLLSLFLPISLLFSLFFTLSFLFFLLLIHHSPSSSFSSLILFSLFLTLPCSISFSLSLYYSLFFPLHPSLSFFLSLPLLLLSHRLFLFVCLLQK